MPTNEPLSSFFRQFRFVNLQFTTPPLVAIDTRASLQTKKINLTNHNNLTKPAFKCTHPYGRYDTFSLPTITLLFNF